MAGELKNRYLRGKTGLRVTSLEQSFNTDMSSHGTSSRRQAETRKGCKRLSPRCWLCSEQRCILLGLNVQGADSLALASLGGQQLAQLLVQMLSRSDHAVLAVVSTQLTVLLQPLVQGASCSPELHKRVLCISSSCLEPASKLDPRYVCFS